MPNNKCVGVLPDCSGLFSKLTERLDNVARLLADAISELADIHKIVYEEPRLVDVPTKIIGLEANVEKLKVAPINQEAENKRRKQEISYENRKYIWAIVIISITSILTSLSSLITAWINSTRP